jgi:type I restriction enzyme S subunit
METARKHIHRREKLEALCSQITDGKHGDCQDDQDSGYYFLSCKDISNGKLNYDGARQITEADFRDTHRRTKLEPHDVLITNSGTIGRMALVPEMEITRRTTFQKSVAILKPITEKVVPSFLYYGLLAEIRRLIEHAGGTAQKNLLLRDLRAFELTVPPLPVQRRIAGILSAYDELIENSQRRIRLLEDMTRALYREWFVHFRFPGHESVPRLPSALGDIPKGWVVKKLADIADVNRAQINARSAPEELHYIDISSVSPGRIDSTTTYAFANAPGRARRIVLHGDILWSCVRPNRRSHALVLHPSLDTIASTGFAVITPSKVPYPFLYFATTTDEFVKFLENSATGAAYPAVTAKTFEDADFIVPSAPLLDAFGKIAIPMAEKIHTLHLKIQNLRHTRDLLLPRLLSGQVALDSSLNSTHDAA